MRFYESRRILWLDHLRQDVRSALRTLAKAPIACAVAIVSLAGGIGATTSTLTVRNAIFYNPPPLYQHPGQLSRVAVSRPEHPRERVTGALYRAWLADETLRQRLAAAMPRRSVEIRVGDRTETTRMVAVTAGLFPLLGVQPSLGRSFPASERPDGPPPLILSHRLWQHLFAQRADVLGTVVWLDQQPHTITGVMPAGFWFGAPDSVVWTPLAESAIADSAALDVVVRRDGGVTASVLGDQLQREASAYAAATGDAGRLRVLVSPVAGTGIGEQFGWVVPVLVGGAVLLTLLIACANVAILMFARWTAREREMAIRSALGASRGRAIALLLTESTMLAVFGGVLGICATFALRGLLIRNLVGAADYDLAIDSGILLQSAAVTLLTGLLAGIAPALYQTRRLQANPLRLLASSDRVRQRWRHALVVLEIAVTVALMVVAGAQIDASRRVLAADVGFDVAPLLTARVENPAGVDTARVLDSVRRLPGVEAAAAGTAIPMVADAPSQAVSTPSGGVTVPAERAHIGQDYFAALGVALKSGRLFATSDESSAARSVLVNDVLARMLWPGGDAIGERLVVDGQTYDVIGVVGAYAFSPMRPAPPRFYLPIPRDGPNLAHVQIIVRAVGDPSSIVRAVDQEIRALGPTYTVPAVYSFRSVIEVGAGEMRAMSYILSPLLAIGMFLTATGIFGVLAFTIARRTNELALRIALGARRGAVARLVMVHTLTLLAVGASAGVAATFALTRVVSAVGGGGSSLDTPGWETFAAPVLIMLIVGGLATWIPTRRAINLDPARLMRAE